MTIIYVFFLRFLYQKYQKKSIHEKFNNRIDSIVVFLIPEASSWIVL